MSEEADDFNFLAWIETQCGADFRKEIEESFALEIPAVLEDSAAEVETAASVTEPEEAPKLKNIRQLIDEMGIPQKIKAAMFGNAICRKLLITNPNRMIQECVLGNPKLQLPEIEGFARSTSVDSQVLRSIAQRTTWMRNYKIKLALVCNPKSPHDVSLKWLKFLNQSDVKTLSRSRNVPQVLQVAAKKKLENSG